MHIADGVLHAGVLAAGAAGAAAGVAHGLRRMDLEDTPRTAVLAAAFFVASLIQVPIGPASLHLVLNGLAGVVLGWTVFPAIFIGLALQLLFFGFGGLTTLGVNTCTMAGAAVCCHYLYRASGGLPGINAFARGFAAGFAGILLGAAFTSAALLSGGGGFLPIAAAFFAGHVPLMLAEGAITGFCVVLLTQVRPEVLLPAMPRAAKEGAVG